MDLNNASVRRFVAILLAPLFAAANAKLGLNISQGVQDLVIGSIVGYILMSNTKEAVIKRSEHAAEVAKSQVTTQDQARSVIEEAVK